MQVFQATRAVLEPLGDLFFPKLCPICRQEVLFGASKDLDFCMACEAWLRPSDFHHYVENPVMQRFWGRLPLRAATAYASFIKGGSVRRLVHQLKYRGRAELGQALGLRCGALLAQAPLFAHVQGIVPVPLHPKKQALRGYNQAAEFGRGLSQAWGIPLLETALQRVEHGESQTKKDRMDRFAGVQTAFALSEQEAIRGRHLLLVDDVITTGATLEACALCLLEQGAESLSLAAIGLA